MPTDRRHSIHGPAAVLVLAGCLSAGEPAVAQVDPAVPLGTRVRVTAISPDAILDVTAGRPAGSRRVAGTLTRLRNDTVLVQVADARLYAIPFDALDRFDVTLGRRSRARRGALIGGLAGLTAGVVTAFIVCADDDCDPSGGDYTGFAVFLLGGTGLLGGAGIGAIVGAVVHTERWQEVSLRQVRMSGAPGSRFALGLTLPIRFP